MLHRGTGGHGHKPHRCRGVSSSTAALPGAMSPAWGNVPCLAWDSHTRGTAPGQGEHPCLMQEHGEEG